MKRSFLIAASAALCALSIVAVPERAAAVSLSAAVSVSGDSATTDISARRKRYIRKKHVSRVHVARAAAFHPECNVVMPCIGAPSYTAKEARADRATERANFGTAYTRADRRARWFASRKQSNVDIFSKGVYLNPAKAGHAVMARVDGLVGPLAAKVAEICEKCGSRVVSGVRHTRIAGTRTMSLHASGRAADVHGNPSCIYAHLKGWPGGYSTDYHTAPGGKHVHISYGGFEHGVRFVHRHYGKRHRYAKRHHRHQYVSARRHHRHANAAQ